MIAQIVVLGLEVHTHERTVLLPVPALAYPRLPLTSDAVVFVFGAGMQNQ